MEFCPPYVTSGDLAQKWPAGFYAPFRLLISFVFEQLVTTSRCSTVALTQATLHYPDGKFSPLSLLRAGPAISSDELDLDLRDPQSRTLQVQRCRMQVCSVCMISSRLLYQRCSLCRQHHSLQRMWQPNRFCSSDIVRSQCKAHQSTPGA